MSLLAIALASARAAAPAHEAVVEPAADTPGNRAYTVCVKQRAAGDGQCIWTLRVEEDFPGVLATRPFAALASDDGLRVAVVLRKTRNNRPIDELWRYHQQMNPDMAVPGTPSSRALVTRSRLIASGYPLSFAGNLALNRFVISDGRRLQAIDDHGAVLAPLHDADRNARSLELVARRGSLSGYAETGANGIDRFVVADLDALDADVYQTRGIALGNEVAWNLERGWVAITDFPAAGDTAAIEARERLGTPTTVRVVDLAYRRSLFEASRPVGPMRPNWVDADTLAWRTDETRTQTQHFDTRAEISLLQATVRAQGERLMFLPCRERAVLLLDDTATSPEITALLRQQLARNDRVFVEAFGSRIGSGVALDTLVQAGNDVGGCQLKPDRATIEASGSDPAWKLTVTPTHLTLDQAGQPSITMATTRLRRVEARRTMAIRTPTMNLDLNAAPQACRDPATQMVQGWRVTVRLSAPGKPARELRGCGRVLRAGIDESTRVVATR